MAKTIKASLFCLSFIFAIYFSIGYFSEIAHSPAGFGGAFLISSVATAIALFSLLIWGIPIHLILEKFKIKSALYYAVFGAIPGVFVIYGVDFMGKDTFANNLTPAVIMGAIGSVAASVFWWFSVGRNA